MTTPTPISVSLAEEIASDVLKSHYVQDLYPSGASKSSLAQIIQRRVEPLEGQRDEAVSLLKQCQGCVAAGIAIAQANGNADFFEKLQADIKAFLARIKEGR